MSDVRSFHLGDILSITTGRLVSLDHIGGVYNILNFMTGDNLMTHQLPRASEECAPVLLRQHPDLANVEVPARFDGELDVRQWLSRQVVLFGERRDVAPVDADDHTVIDPIAELAMMRPDVQVIVIEPPDVTP